MVDVRPVDESDLDAFRSLHNRYVGRDVSPATVQSWHDDHAALLLGAFDDGELVGHCHARPYDDETVEIDGIAVDESHRRRGIGADLLAATEARAASLGYRAVTVGSAGGYVDEFYVANGYEPDSVLVRLDPDDDVPAAARTAYDVVSERTVDGTRTLYVATDGFDPAFPDAVGAAFGDPDAIHVMRTSLDRS